MIFDLFHSIGRIDSQEPKLNNRAVFSAFIEQTKLAESLGFDTVWLAESHFSSEVQKKHHPNPVIPNFDGEIGLNADAMQLIQFLTAKTNKINFGTAIFNVVGGCGGPIAAADRISSLLFFNTLHNNPRDLRIGFAAGRFPYVNEPFGIVPRDSGELKNWNLTKRIIFLEAQEIFMRLLRGEVLSSEMLKMPFLPQIPEDFEYKKRWNFLPLKLVPEITGDTRSHLYLTLGSHDPLARELGFSLGDVDLFNLSFTPPEQLDRLNQELTETCIKYSRKPWTRSRLPRTVLVYIDKSQAKAESIASRCFDTYIEGMRGTVSLPPKSELMSRALIGDPSSILDKLRNPELSGIHSKDRLMLWFEYAQNNLEDVSSQMKLFGEEVMAKL